MQSWAPSTSGRSDDKAASLLYFDDRPQAHGLFEFLMHETLGSSEAVDVPMLLGPVPFVGATFHQHVPHVSSLSCLFQIKLALSAAPVTRQKCLTEPQRPIWPPQ